MLKPTAIRAAALMLCAGVIVLCATGCAKPPKGRTVTPVDGRFAVGVDEVGVGDVVFFGYDTAGKRVVFFVARTDSGEVHTALDACVTCYPHRMGYRQEDDCVVCTYCGMRFGLETLGEGRGSCVPIKLPHRLEGGRILIEQADVEAGAKWF